MNDKHIVGFDFGTTNSLVSKVQDGRAINFPDKEGMPFPSVVGYEGAKKIYGRKAKNRLGEVGLGVQGNIVYSPKRYLGEESIFVAGVKRSPVDIVSDVVGFVARETRTSARAKGIELEKIDRAVVTIPVAMDGKRRARLRDAFRRAGVRIEQFVHEPLAAIYGFFRSQDDMAAMLRQYNRKLILVFDWGGGTLDLTLCRLEDGKLDQLANDGTADVGGDFFDDLLQKEIIRRVLRERDIENPEYRKGAETCLRHECELAKIDLSSRDTARVHVPGFFRGLSDEDLDYSLSRADLVDITKLLLDKGFSRIKDLLEKAGVSGAYVDLCLPTGGMTNMPEVKSRLNELFGPQRVQDHARKETLVAEGAAWIAHDGARLHLAKDIELLLARNSYMALLKAGMLLPTEGKIMGGADGHFDLYCTDPSDGHAKFQLCAPIDLGRVEPYAPRRALGNLIVKVDAKAEPFFERLCLTASVNDNLILKAEVGPWLPSKGNLDKDAWLPSKDHRDEKEVHNIEFGLTFPGELPVKSDSNDSTAAPASAVEHEKHSVVVRSNVFYPGDGVSPPVTHEIRKHWMSQIPGDLLHARIEKLRKNMDEGNDAWDNDIKNDCDYGIRLNSGDLNYFDKRHDPLRIQVREKLYYTPCIICGRPSNHHLCNCASLLE